MSEVPLKAHAHSGLRIQWRPPMSVPKCYTLIRRARWLANSHEWHAVAEDKQAFFDADEGHSQYAVGGMLESASNEEVAAV